MNISSKFAQYLCLITIIITLTGCASVVKNRNVQGETFPTVQGSALDGKAWQVPKDLSGKTVLLIGFVQDSQFDIDRWLIGLDMKKAKVPFIEIPTIRGMFPRMFRKTIDKGMRRGIPEDMWAGVVTVYNDAHLIVDFLGNENPNNARVLVVDQTGRVYFSYNDGFSVNALNKLLEAL